MKITTTISAIVLLAMTACATQAVIAITKSKCSNLGYAPGSVEMANCIDRSVTKSEAVQDATITYGITYAILNAIF